MKNRRRKTVKRANWRISTEDILRMHTTDGKRMGR